MNTEKAISVIHEFDRTGIKPGTSLQELMEEMRDYGLPRLTMPDKNGWYCAIDMYTNALGAEFKVASEFKHRTTIDAVEQCYIRMKSALAALKEPK